MQSITVSSHVGKDGILRLQVPVGLTDVDLEVMVIIQPVGSTPAVNNSKSEGWPPGFFEQTFGCLRDDPLVREPQGEFEERDVLF